MRRTTNNNPAGLRPASLGRCKRPKFNDTMEGFIMSDNPTKTLTHEQLDRFRGDLVRYGHAFNPRVIYTPGVKFLAEKGEAFWLIDVIACYLTPKIIEKAALDDPRVRSLHFWRLEVADDNSAVVTARVDSGYDPFVSQEIPFTDFPLEYADVWAGFDSRFWTLYLPSEH